MFPFQTQKESSSSLSKLTQLIMLLSVFPLYFFCHSSNHFQTKILFQTSRSKFILTVDGKGELDAKNSLVMQTPRVWPAPKISYLVPEGTQVKKEDVIVKFQAAQIETDYLNALDELEIAKAEAEKKYAELELQRLVYESQKNTAEVSAATAKLQLSQLDFESQINKEIKRLEIAQQELAAERAQKKLVSLEKIQQAESSHAQMKIRQAENKIDQCKSQLDKLILKAPFAGIIIHETNWISDQKVKEGDALYPGMPVVKLPDLTIMQAKLQVAETDAQQVKDGQITKINVPSIGSMLLPGKVVHVDKIAKPIKRGSKIKKVEVIVEIDTTFQELVPGLTAEGKIEVGEINEAMVVPQECIFEKDSVKIVYTENSGNFQAHAIAISDQNENYYVIASDLKGGEKLALHEPSSSRIHFPDSLKAPPLPKKEVALAQKDTLQLVNKMLLNMDSNRQILKREDVKTQISNSK